MSINRKTITASIQKKLNLTYEEAHELVEVILTSIEDTVLAQESVKIPNFGSFCIKERKQSVCPLNDKPIKTLRSMRFHASGHISKKLHDSDHNTTNDDYFM